MSGVVHIERHSGVAIVTLDDPRLKNALSFDVSRQLLSICDEIDADETVGAVVLRGANGTFCSGADTNTWDDTYADPASAEARAATDLVYGAFYRIGQLRPPVIAAIRGAAVGAGLNLALGADLRIVARDARLLGGFVGAGIHPGGGFFTIASRVAGREAAAALGMFSQELSGTRAAELGLAWQAVDDSDVEEVAFATASMIAGDPEFSRKLVHSFRLETGAASMPWAVAMELERGVQIWSQGRRRQGPATSPTPLDERSTVVTS